MKKSNYLFALALGVSTLTFAQVGIGTSTPSSPLDIEATNAALDINNSDSSDDPKINFQLSGTTNFSIGVDNADSKFKIGTTAPATSTAITIENDGDVGIGTTSPEADLHVNSYTNGFKVGNTSDAGMLYTTYEDGSACLTLEEDADALILRGIQADAADTAYITFNNGNVGMGDLLKNPNSMLEILNTDATANAVEDMLTITKATSGTSAAGIGAGLIFEIEDGGNTEEQGRINVELDDVTNNSEDATMTFDINQNGAMTEFMRIDGTSGYVGIGTSSPAARLHIDGDGTADGAAILEITSDGDRNIEIRNPVDADGNSPFQFWTGNAWEFLVDGNSTLNIHAGGDTYIATTSDADFFRVDYSADRVGIGTSSPGYTFDVSGDINYSGSLTNVSDKRFKKDITKIKNALSLINQFDGYHYNFRVDEFPSQNFDTVAQIGFIAQELNEVLPQLVSQNDSGYYSVNYIKVVPVLVMAMKEQQAIIKAQKKEIAKEKAENESQKAEIENLKAEASNSSAETNQKLDINTAEIEKLKAQLNALLQAQTATVSAVK